MMEQTDNQRVYVVMSEDEHDIRIVMRALELALCNAILDNTSKFVFVSDKYYGDVKEVVQAVAKRNKIEAPDDIFGFVGNDKPNSEFVNRKIIVYKPSSPTNTVTKNINEVINLNNQYLHRRFVHIFRDDLILTADWNPLMIEMMMHEFGFPFYCDPKMNRMNMVFGKLSPVKTFVYQKKVGDKEVLPYPVVFYAYDDDAYVVFDTESKAWKTGVIYVDQRLRRKWVSVYEYNLVVAGIMPSYDYLPDPFLSATATPNPLFEKLTDKQKTALIEDLKNDKPLIEELNVKRKDNDFERWPDVLKKLTDTCDALEAGLLKETFTNEQQG